MLFKDQAQQLLARWECLRDEDELDTIAVQTAISLSRIEDVPEHVLKALDGLLDYEYEKRARRIYDVVRYLRSLSDELRAMASQN